MRSWHNSRPQYLLSALRPTTGCGSRKRSAACAHVGTRVVSSTFGTGVHNRTHARPCEGLRRSGLFGPCAADFPHEGAVEDAFGEQGMRTAALCYADYRAKCQPSFSALLRLQELVAALAEAPHARAHDELQRAQVLRACLRACVASV